MVVASTSRVKIRLFVNMCANAISIVWHSICGLAWQKFDWLTIASCMKIFILRKKDNKQIEIKMNRFFFTIGFIWRRLAETMRWFFIWSKKANRGEKLQLVASKTEGKKLQINDNFSVFSLSLSHSSVGFGNFLMRICVRLYTQTANFD